GRAIEAGGDHLHVGQFAPWTVATRLSLKRASGRRQRRAAIKCPQVTAIPMRACASSSSSRAPSLLGVQSGEASSACLGVDPSRAARGLSNQRHTPKSLYVPFGHPTRSASQCRRSPITLGGLRCPRAYRRTLVGDTTNSSASCSTPKTLR